MPGDSRPSIVPALGFSALTPLYDAVLAVTLREKTFRRALVDQAALLPGLEVLDLACGTGTLAVMMGRREGRARITGVDADPQVLAIASRKARDAGLSLRLDEAYSTQLPYAAESFDRVVSSLFFHHLSAADKATTAREALRVLRPGGELHVADWGRAANPFLRAAFLAVQLLDGFANTHDNVAGRLPAFFTEAGFEGVAETRTFATAFGTLALYRALKPRAGLGTSPAP